MEEVSSNATYIIGTVITAIIGGVGWLVKHYFEKAEEEQKRIFAERDADKQEMKDNISDLQHEVKKTQKQVDTLRIKIMTCKHEDCPNKLLLAEELEKE